MIEAGYVDGLKAVKTSILMMQDYLVSETMNLNIIYFPSSSCLLLALKFHRKDVYVGMIASYPGLPMLNIEKHGKAWVRG